jgi:hypothetical protein
MRKSKALWGALLIFAGIIWILESTGTFSINLGGAFLTLWPILIIAAGITLFLNKEAHWPRVILWLLVFAIIGGYAFYLGYSDRETARSDNTFDLVDGMISGRLQLDAMAADLKIDSTNKGLAQVDTNISGIKHRFSGGKSSTIFYYQNLKLGSNNKGTKFSAALSREIPWSIELNTSAVDGSIDFSDIMLESCNVNTAACDLDIIAGTRQDRAAIKINSMSVNINITIPKGVGIRIVANSMANDVSGEGIVKKDRSRYESENFNSADKQIIMELNSMSTTVKVRVR